MRRRARPRRRLRAHPPRTPHEIIVAPEGAPRTKPRALNIAMPFARGALVAVFDAEDIPEAGQLRRAAAIFDQARRRARLPAGQPRHRQWRAQLDDGPVRAGICGAVRRLQQGPRRAGSAAFSRRHIEPFPHRGACARSASGTPTTSPRTPISACVWRARAIAVRTFDSHTCEEAPADFAALVKQRTRWLKGWMQTALVHCRHPAAPLRRSRRRAARWRCSPCSRAASLGPLLGPVPDDARSSTTRCSASLLAPAHAFRAALRALWCLSASRRGGAVWPLLARRAPARLRRAARCVFLPLWLLMLSLPSWRASSELWRRPFHWEKTEHGLTRRGAARLRRRAIA